MSLLQQKAVALFHFLLRKQENDRRIGELSFADLMELVKFLNGDAVHANQ